MKNEQITKMLELLNQIEQNQIAELKELNKAAEKLSASINKSLEIANKTLNK
jgi:hypothetical protein